MITAVKFLLSLILLLYQAIPRPVYGMDVFNTKPFRCLGDWRELEWTNEGEDIRIYNAQLWMGMYKDAVSDLGFAVKRTSDDSLLFRGNWDHYANPVGINNQIVQHDFSPNYFELKNGDSLRLYYTCSDMGGDAVGHIIVTVWYTK
jgi:hypothetical protein